jgi:putative oxidoreductase
VPDFVWKILLRRRVHGNAAWVAGLLRVVVGAVFTFGFAVTKFTDHAKEVRDFRSWDVPVPTASVYLAGLLELVCGLMLIFGVLTRLAAFVLAAEMVVAVLTAGRAEGFGFHTIVPPLLFVALLYLVYAGAGPASVDRLLERGFAPQPDAEVPRKESRAARKARELEDLEDSDTLDPPKLGKDWA